VDEQVRVGGARPTLVAVVQVGRQPDADGLGEQDGPVVEVQAAVVDVGEPQVTQLPGRQAVESQQCGHRRAGGVWRGQTVLHQGQVGGQRLAAFGGAEPQLGRGIVEDDLVRLEHLEDRSQTGADGVAVVAAGRQDRDYVVAADLAQRPDTVIGPLAESGQSPAQFDLRGNANSRATAWHGDMAVAKYSPPQTQLVNHRVRQTCDARLAPDLGGRGDVVLDQRVAVKEIGDQLGWQVDAGQLVDQAGRYRRAGVSCRPRRISTPRQTFFVVE
jgi:hypothetical protein